MHDPSVSSNEPASGTASVESGENLSFGAGPAEQAEDSSDSTFTIPPVSGIYAIAPPTSPNYLRFNDGADKTAFYTTEGLAGTFISCNWSDMESGQGTYTPFTSGQGNPIYDSLSDLINTNPDLNFVLAVGAGPGKVPDYIQTGTVTVGTTFYIIPNVAIPGVQNGGDTIYSPFPFDPVFVNRYKEMISYVLTQLATITLGDPPIVPLSRLTSIKLGLYTSGDSEIAISSWNNSVTGTARSDAQYWLTAFTTPNYRDSDPGTSSWPGAAASTWQDTINTAFVSYAEWLAGTLSTLASMYDLPNLNSLTFGAPLIDPKISFPLISSTGTIIACPATGLPDNSAVPALLLSNAATAVSNPSKRSIPPSVSVRKVAAAAIRRRFFALRCSRPQKAAPLRCSKITAGRPQEGPLTRHTDFPDRHSASCRRARVLRHRNGTCNTTRHSINSLTQQEPTVCLCWRFKRTISAATAPGQAPKARTSP